MEWIYLEKLWEQTVKPGGAEPAVHTDWNKSMEALYSLGIGMEKTLCYLYHEQPGLPEFKTWIESQSAVETQQPLHASEAVLTEDDLAFWNENGFVVVKDAIPRTDCMATQQAIWEFLGMDPGDSTTWYRQHEAQGGMMLALTDHPCLNRNRQSPVIRKAFEQLYQSIAIYKSIDKVSFNPPETRHYSFRGSPLHWDISLKQPVQFVLQGLLYLSDCGEKDGAFHCVPGFHNRIGNWLGELAAGENARDVAPLRLEPVPVPGRAGDFVIWQGALPHGATPNQGTSPRMVQYLTYLPMGYQETAEWI